MERHRYYENQRDYEKDMWKQQQQQDHSKHAEEEHLKKYDVDSKHSRCFEVDDVSNDEIEHRHHHRRHHKTHRHRHRRRHHKHKNSDDNVKVKLHKNAKEDAYYEYEEMEKPLTRRPLDSPAAISVSSSHSSLSNTNYSHSPAVKVEHESDNQAGKDKLQNSNNYSKRSGSASTPASVPSPKRSRTNTPHSSSSHSSDNNFSAVSSNSNSRHSIRKSSDSDSDDKELYLSHNSHSSRSSSSSGSSSSSSSTLEEIDNNEKSEMVKDNGETRVENVSKSNMNSQTAQNVNGEQENDEESSKQLPDYYPGVQGCRSVEEFQCLNRIEEGTYGVVYRAKDKKTSELVALKRLKMEKETEGFPITSLREINTLLKGQHPNIVTVREIVVGSNMDQIFIVMDYVEHDIKSLMQTMKSRKQTFLPSEVKCLTQQLLSAVAHLHDNWILHRDLKTSNLLLSHKGILKVADFGLAREYGSPIKRYTPVVVTLWYRAPELLLCSPVYSTPVDMWSVGCIFAELLRMNPIFTGQTEIDQLSRIYKELGTPNEKIWPGYKELPAVKNMLSVNSQFTDYPISNLKKRFVNTTTDLGIDLLQGMLTYDPEKRLSAEKALQHAYFKELPLPIDPSMFPTWPAKSELGERKQVASPKPPPGGAQFKQLEAQNGQYTKGAGFQLKF